jgi:hypothetical protein
LKEELEKELEEKLGTSTTQRELWFLAGDLLRDFDLVENNFINACIK